MEITNINNQLTLSDENRLFLERNLPYVIGSDGTKKKFRENRIINSIFKETSAPLDVAISVASEITKMLLVSKQKIITAPYIREKACGILFNINPKWRDEYTRLGIPFADFLKAYGHLFEDIDSWETLTPQNVYDLIIPKMNSVELIELVYRIVKDFIGVRNNIQNADDELENCK